MKKRFCIIVGILFVLMPMVSSAQTYPNSASSVSPPTSFPNSAPSASPSPNSGAPVQSSGSYTVQNPLGNNINSVCSLIKAILSAAIQIGIPIAVLFIIWAGFKFVLARGNEEALRKAKANLMYTLIGIAIFLGAWLLAQLIATTVNNIQAGSTNSAISCQ